MNSKPWTKKELETLSRLRDGNCKAAQIAIVLGRSTGSTAAKLRSIYGTQKERNSPKDTKHCICCKKKFFTNQDYRMCNSCRTYASDNSHMSGIA